MCLNVVDDPPLVDTPPTNSNSCPADCEVCFKGSGAKCE